MQFGLAFNLVVLHAHHITYYNTALATFDRYPQPGRCHYPLPPTHGTDVSGTLKTVQRLWRQLEAALDPSPGVMYV